MEPLKKKKPSELFARAGILGGLFIIVLIFFISTSKREKSIDLGSQLLNGMAKYTSFEEKQKDSLKLRNAGFWQFNSDTNTLNQIVYLTDRFELKTNGIFWQASEYTIGLPSQKSTHFIHVVTGYMNPFAKAGTGPDSLVCDVHIIRHAYVMGNDTCFGPSNVDTTWIVVANGKRFELGGNGYQTYDTTGDALYRFFPKGALGIIENPREKNYQVGNKTIYLAKKPVVSTSKDAFKFCLCPPEKDFFHFLRNAIAQDMSTVQVDKLTTDGIQKIIDAYYRILLEQTMRSALRSDNARKGNVKVAFNVTWEGKTSDCAIVNISLRDDQVKRRILSEIGSWTFPQLKTQAPALHVEREFWF